VAETRGRSLFLWIAVPALAVGLYVLFINIRPRAGSAEADVDRNTAPRFKLAERDLGAVADLAARALSGADTSKVNGLPPRLDEPNHGVYAALRAGGLLRSAEWQDGGSVREGLVRAIEAAQSHVPENRRASIDTIEVCIAHSYRRERTGTRDRFLANIHRGVRGLELRYRDVARKYSPTEMIARNLSYKKALAKFQERHRIGDEQLELGHVHSRTFECEQLLVFLGPPPTAVRMQRGNQLVELADVTRTRVGELKRLLGDWLLRNLHPDGRMTYKWWPSRGEESSANNMIRQWMASIALVRLAADRGEPALADAAERNIRYNLAHFYHEEDGHGFIEWDGKAKLGAVSLAALAIVEHPRRAEFAEYERALIATTFLMQHEDGSFQTFYKPRGRQGQNNFYPGETLLLWSVLYRENEDAKLLERFLTSFRYFRKWHREHRNPAFIPWHTQAYFNVWERTGDPELRDFVFEMNDWLLGIQEWDDAIYPDTRGRFYDYRRSYFGPPHASSTGVYLEGLIDAYRMAVRVGDRERQFAYRRAIVRGLRSVLQLQFADDVDMYYVSKRNRVLGGMRTTVYDNAIRVDNVQHNLLAIFRIHTTFSEDDYRL